MQRIESRLTVYFDKPFWVGVYERFTEDKLEVCKITFGAEPKDYEVYEYLLQHWRELKFSPPIKSKQLANDKVSYKRLQRKIEKQLSITGVGTKAQQAIKFQQAEGKEARKKKSRLQREEERQRQFELRQQKKIQKRRGH